ncbi:ZIP family metal transporter [Sporosalibacterium faouarense]|uniref:ZIP family metal transporter n=1 Tax=Sporosalibacterium faouarense TaxID=516123 RepID=UPI00192BEFD8|nr:ZIP family metal transporter [Sporosalibacterium faouarense]
MNGILISILVGACTGLGALPLIFVKSISKATKNGLLGFAGGIMVFASSFSLIQPAMREGSLISVISGIITGTLLLTAIEKTIPHAHGNDLEKNAAGEDNRKEVKNTLLLVLAVAIHNIPEGLAIGVGYGSGSITSGLNLALAIGVQNIPEGLIVGATLLQEGSSKTKAILVSFLTGIGEPIAATIAILTLSAISNFMPFILSMTAGAMYYVVSNELIPESHCEGNELLSTYGFILGLILMIVFNMLIGK